MTDDHHAHSIPIPGIDESRDAYLARWQDAMHEIARLRAEIDSWEAASVAKTAEVAALRARIAFLEAVAYVDERV